MLKSSPLLATTGVRFWIARAGYGLLLAVVIAALEFAYYFPLVSMRNELGLGSIHALLIGWGGECVLLALSVGAAEFMAKPRELRGWKLAVTVAGGAFLAAFAWNMFCDYVLRDQLGMKMFVDHVGQPVPWIGRAFYHGWMMLFFGGLAIAMHSSLRRRARMLVGLRAAELGRETSQQRLAEITLGSLQARIDPEFVFQTLRRLEALYDADPEEADRLLQELIAFLRSALSNVHASSARVAVPESRELGHTLPVT